MKISFGRSILLAIACSLGVPATQNQSSSFLYAQSATTGALSGVVTDPTGAILPNAVVTIIDASTGTRLTVTSNESGHYSANLLKPDAYKVSAKANGLSSDTIIFNVNVGQQTIGDVKVTPSGNQQAVEVSAETIPLIDSTTASLTTTFNQEQIQSLPTPGGDITTLAFTAPGVIVNAGGSFGNFSSNGLPSISNLFVYNGFDNQDPFLNLNNSGSSNLTLGQGEVAEASIIQNGYSTQYGRAAGAIINYTTKSGGNRFHGLASYYYNGSVLNANEWFRNNNGSPREHAVSNEFALNLSGPIIKDKLFFFVDYEFLHYVLPNSAVAVFPSQQFENFALANVPAAALPLYKQAFALYAAAPAFASAVPITTGTGQLQDSGGNLGCGNTGFTGTTVPGGGTFGVDTPCATAAVASASNVNKEWLLAGRVDYVISPKQQIFGRYKMDRGSQPTFTNFSAPVFNATSVQPSYEGQLNDTYSLNSNITNQFIFAANWYTAFFGPANLAASQAAFPSFLTLADGGANNGATLGNLGVPPFFPQGRNVTQYQFIDDLSVVKGKNSLKFGYNFRRNDISDYDAQENISGTYNLQTVGDFANGQIDSANKTNSSYLQSFPSVNTAHVALYNIGIYAQDDVKLKPNFTLSAGIRFDRTGNPLCSGGCFARYNGAFPAANSTNDTPYNTLINSNQSNAFNGVEKVIYQPRVGFNWDVFGSGKTVLRGGGGLFADLYPSILVDSLIQNFPNSFSSQVFTGAIAASGPGSLPANAAAASRAVKSGFTAGQSFNQIQAALAAQGVPFSQPSLGGAVPAGTFQAPKYVEYNLQIQQQISRTNAIVIGYAGNVGYDLLFNNPKQNASLNQSSGLVNFVGLPATSPDPNFLSVNAITNFGHSNYNGISTTFKHMDGRGLTLQVTYNYTHALDNITSNPQEPYNSGSITSQLDPTSVDRLNYSNGDNDVRNNLTMDGVWALPYKVSNHIVNTVLAGWSVGAKTYYRSGEPFSLFNANEANAVGPTSGGFTAAQQIAPVPTHSCSNVHALASNANGLSTTCFSNLSFASDPTTVGTSGYSSVLQNTFGNVRRNSFYGPHYADTDISLYKKVYTREGASFTIGANAFNTFNHPNFGQPLGDVSQTSVGSIGSTISPPTSPYGSFQGAAVSGRVIQVLGKIIF